jgi:hypothetical protein
LACGSHDDAGLACKGDSINSTVRQVSRGLVVTLVFDENCDALADVLRLQGAGGLKNTKNSQKTGFLAVFRHEKRL